MKHTITALKWHKSQPDRVMMHLDGKPGTLVSLVAAGRFKVGDRIDAETVMQLQAGQNRREAHQSALRFLGVRDRSTLEIRQKLKRQGYDEGVIDHVLQDLIDKNYVNDQAFAINWVNHRMKISPRSLRLIRQELKQKGVSQERIEAAVIRVEEHELAMACIHRKRRRWRRFAGRERTFKMLAHLSHKGFSYDVSRKAVASYRDQAD